MITTDRGRMGQGHLIVHADDPSGPWSDPVFTHGIVGIDPDLVWDDQGRSWVAWADAAREGISIVEVDLATGALMGEPKHLWAGSGLAYPEGPHLYRRDSWWYLVIAEGGTHTGHAVSVARSRNLLGPYEANPANPILSHRSSAHPVQATGHADLVELADGSWAMVHLGIRQRGDAPGWHVNGRETFVAGVEWIDGWPVVGPAPERHCAETPIGTVVDDDFTGDTLDPRWVSPGAHPSAFAAPTRDGLQLRAGRAPATADVQGFLGVRARDTSWHASARVSDGDVALTLRVDDLHWASVERVGSDLRARIRIGPLDQAVGSTAGVPLDAPLSIRVENGPRLIGVRSGPDVIRLGFGDEDGFVALASFDGRYLSTEVAGGYTGRVIGLEALGGSATVTRFTYRPIDDPVAPDPYAALNESFGPGAHSPQEGS